MYTTIKNGKNNENISSSIVTSIRDTLQKNGYCVKTNFRYPNRISSGLPIKFGNYIPDVFAYKSINDIVIIDFETCGDILSSKNENIWKSMAFKPGLDFHIIVPPCCREKAKLKSKIKNIPVKIHCTNDWKNSLELSLGMSK